MTALRKRDCCVVFPSSLGWMALVYSGGSLGRLTFGHRWPAAAAAAVGIESAHETRPDSLNRLVRRLQAYVLGNREDFRDVEIDPGRLTAFERRVVQCCRNIPYGKTLTYGQLAAEAGSPRAARAVGNCMAANPIPLVIPCHRVVAAGGGLGGYSAPGGTRLKGRLLELEHGHRVGPLLFRSA